VRLLVALLLRALGATLLLGIAVLPTADHHAAGRLADEPGRQREDAHYLMVHHHPRPLASSAPAASVAALATADDGLTDAPPPTAHSTIVVPTAPSVDSVLGGTPIVDAVVLGFVLASAARALAGAATSRPPSRALRVPVPPPRSALLSAA
jgi:hypothetical protein